MIADFIAGAGGGWIADLEPWWACNGLQIKGQGRRVMDCRFKSRGGRAMDCRFEGRASGRWIADLRAGARGFGALEVWGLGSSGVMRAYQYGRACVHALA